MRSLRRKFINAFLFTSLALFAGLALAACATEEKDAANSNIAAANGTAHQPEGGSESIQASPTETPKTEKPADIFASFKKGANYKLEIRSKILKDGWQPARAEDADVCGSGDSTCDEFPEMNHCAGTGLGNCEFRWQKGDRILLVYTVGETPTYQSYEFEKASKETKETVSGSSDSAILGKFVYKDQDEYFDNTITYEFKPDNIATFTQYSVDSGSSNKDGGSKIVDEGTWEWNAEEKIVTATFTYKAGNKSVRRMKLNKGSLIETSENGPPRTFKKQ